MFMTRRARVFIRKYSGEITHIALQMCCTASVVDHIRETFTPGRQNRRFSTQNGKRARELIASILDMYNGTRYI